MNIADAVRVLEENVPNPSAGLPEELFLYISRTTPLVNVDLLIKDEMGRTLLSWRNDEYAGKGWHVPGGIVRLKETLEARARNVCVTEIGAKVSFEPAPLAIHQFIHPERSIRSHFISILFKGFLPSGFVPSNKGLLNGDRGYLLWHDGCPENLIKAHEIYREYINQGE